MAAGPAPRIVSECAAYFQKSKHNELRLAMSVVTTRGELVRVMIESIIKVFEHISA